MQASVTHITWRNIALACKDITSQKCTWWSPHCSLFQLLRESTCRPQPTTLTPSMLASQDLLRGTPPPEWHRHNSTAVVSCHTQTQPNSFQSQHKLKYFQTIVTNVHYYRTAFTEWESYWPGKENMWSWSRAYTPSQRTPPDIKLETSMINPDIFQLYFCLPGKQNGSKEGFLKH